MLSILHFDVEALKPSPSSDFPRRQGPSVCPKDLSQSSRAGRFIDVDDGDSIEVLEEVVHAIPIRPKLSKHYSDRHQDLHIGSIHARNQVSSPIEERCRRDPHDFVESEESDTDPDDDFDDDDNDFYSACRGRGRQPKPLSRRSSRSREHQLGEDDEGDLDFGYAVHHRTRGPARYRRQSKLSPSAASPTHASPEPGAVVFDNFEDAFRPSPKEREEEKACDSQLHFVRNATSICTNPSAAPFFEATSAGASDDDGDYSGSKSDNQVAKKRPGPVGRHQRSSSEAFLQTALSSPSSKLIRAARRRATIGSDHFDRYPRIGQRQKAF